MERVRHPDVTAQVTWVVNGRPITRKYIRSSLPSDIGLNNIGRFEKSADKIQVVSWWREVLSKNRGFEK